MADSLFQSYSVTPESSSLMPLVVIRRVVYTLSLMTLVLMAIGSATRVMNAGLACPDWPLCYGSWVPAQQMNLQVFLEWFHRLIASSIGFCVLSLTAACWWLRRQLPKWLPISMSLSLGIVLFQGILGGLTVTQLLRFDIVTAHLATGLLFFCSLVVIGSFLRPYQGTGVTGTLHWNGFVAAVCVYMQSVLGALVASRWAVHQCLDTAALCHVLNTHMLSAVPASVAVLWLIVRTWRTAALHPFLRRLNEMMLTLLLLQVAIGVSTLRLHLQIEWLTVSHQAVGAALVGVLVCYTVLALRDRLQGQGWDVVQGAGAPNSQARSL